MKNAVHDMGITVGLLVSESYKNCGMQPLNSDIGNVWGTP